MDRSPKRVCPDWNTIPAPVLFQLLVSLPLRDALALALTNAAAAKVWRLRRLWETRLKQDFGVEALNDETALQAYKDENMYACALGRGDRIILYGLSYWIDLSDNQFLNKLFVYRKEYFYIWCALRRKNDIDLGRLLISAARKNELDVVKRLVHHGADVYEQDLDLSPVIIALEKHHVRVFAFLLGHVELDKHDLTLLCGEYQTWALHEAFRQNKIVDVSGMLHHACENGVLASVQILLDHGADPTQTDYRGKTPIELARQMHHHHVVEYLEYRINNGT